MGNEIVGPLYEVRNFLFFFVFVLFSEKINDCYKESSTVYSFMFTSVITKEWLFTISKDCFVFNETPESFPQGLGGVLLWIDGFCFLLEYTK